jgi:hypothetical protein
MNIKTQFDKIIAALLLIKELEPDTTLQAEHDVVYAGSIMSFEKMTEKQKKNMKKWGWEFDESLDVWVRYI